METDFINFDNRTARSNYISKRFAKYLVGSILDVGCDRAVLKDLLKNVNYTGIDIAGTPDIKVDLEKIERLPFEDNSFTTTVCSDVLEHLDNFHYVLSEIVRVTNNYIIISLPNGWAAFRKAIKRGSGKRLHYGLPPVSPQDRHKWFFSFSEALDFAKEQEKLHNLSVIELVANENPRLFIKRFLRRLRYFHKEQYLNRYGYTLWIVFKKNDFIKGY